MSTENQSSDKKPRRRRWLVVAFTISLALNLLVAGAITARVFFHQGGWRHGDAGHVGAMRSAGRHLLWSLPRERRQELRQIVMGHKPNLEALRKEMFLARKELATVIGAPVLDKEKVEAVFAKMGMTEDKAKQEFRTLGREFIQNLTAEERARFAGYLVNRRWRRH